MDMEGPQGRQRLHAILLHPVTGIVLPVMLFAAGPLFTLTRSLAILGIAVLLASLTALRAVLSAQEAGGYKKAATRGFQRAVGLGLYPLESLSSVCKAIDAASAMAALDGLRAAVLETAREACGPDSPKAREKRRAVIYEFNGDALKFVKKRGRHDDPPPRGEFTPGSTPERDVVAWVRAAAASMPSPDLVPDVSRAPYSRGSATGEHYKSFVSIPIAMEGKAYGLLAVDSKDPKSFSGLDGQTVRMLATILAAGLARTGSMPLT